MRKTKTIYCPCSVTRAGGYYAGSCGRPRNHEGSHRQRMTQRDRASIDRVGEIFTLLIHLAK